MNNRQLETAREIRLWITRVIFPTGIIVGTIIMNKNGTLDKVGSILRQFTGGYR